MRHTSPHTVYEAETNECVSRGAGNLVVWFWEEPEWPLGFQRAPDWVWAEEGAQAGTPG